ncbi:lipocalin family protein [Winogradskyella bathintestinalis]|uniref:DUF5004 domain-containing protein n=1 Tax=Winogradskyella bathintestinalis TaxID=3035208 RepID=A0ABT7ZQQ8_9FLAO|nr:DUF5004 domain-containing protein [Winogradskyella bathintestinalis]MDN3491341.1 DUF5004 domain-containing protein [Winogradskyella bathintestinalis]
MKKIYLLALALVTIFSFTACSSDDDGNSNPSENLIGEWEATTEVYRDFVNGELVDSGEEVYGDDEIERVTFNADGTFNSFYSESYVNNGEIEEYEITREGTYTINGDNLVITTTDDDGTDITEVSYGFSGGNLEIYEVDEDQFGGTEYRYEYTIIYERR